MNPVLTRFSAAAAVCALVLTGAAVWRALSPPGLDDLRDVTGDRTALDGFSVSLHYGENDRYDSVLTFDSGKAAAPQADYSPLSAHERYLGYINRTISLIRNGRAVRESHQLHINTELVAQSPGCHRYYYVRPNCRSRPIPTTPARSPSACPTRSRCRRTFCRPAKPVRAARSTFRTTIRKYARSPITAARAIPRPSR